MKERNWRKGKEEGGGVKKEARKRGRKKEEKVKETAF